MKSLSLSLSLLLLLLLLVSSVVSGYVCANEVDSLIDTSSIRAQIVAKHHAVLSAEMTGRINRMQLREGQKLDKGELLVAFDCDIQKAQLSKAKAQQSASRNTLSGHRRMAELNAIGEVELENSRLELAKSQADVDYLNAQIKRCELRAPYSGVIADLMVNEHEFIQIGSPILEILDTSELQVEFIAPSSWISWLKPGYPFSILVEDTGKIYQSEVSYIGAKVDAVSQSIKVVARISDLNEEIRPGMSGQIQMVQDQK
ncbi:efflux RND transporter periplasmic adaptor subunit [Vibrio diazotrophicus]|uniref:efflux RND transporter periplasmic adaptor subunit n=1 Tax=Vibrio diazotrophicus TaxID=685 RepID=UPI000C9EC2A2|nr:efflux RND transporter periplasmic adaptor subunit [Vibrio diazotrophicus]PNH95405.1 efflux transporter periplasmic adaptor subunit [Vibrio diazotrophicus]